ncbi:hypothetical protein MPLB_1110005 [Mesorhizobium sp. ORS 3324]|nr:hypothetical protein MPLB_1110005 [Mesorhizobium sp. ORS 3324]
MVSSHVRDRGRHPLGTVDERNLTLGGGASDTRSGIARYLSLALHRRVASGLEREEEPFSKPDAG